MAIIHVTKENFEEAVLKSEKKVLLDFWASWCGPCRMVAPVLDEIAQENEEVVIAKIDVDAEMELAAQFGITSIPTLVLMEGGKPTAQAIGYRPKADIVKQFGL